MIMSLLDQVQSCVLQNNRFIKGFGSCRVGSSQLVIEVIKVFLSRRRELAGKTAAELRDTERTNRSKCASVMNSPFAILPELQLTRCMVNMVRMAHAPHNQQQRQCRRGHHHLTVQHAARSRSLSGLPLQRFNPNANEASRTWLPLTSS